jgi:hypothetical protein
MTLRYDIIWLDVYDRHLIPFHLTTQEFFSQVRSRLHPDGVMVLNLASSGDRQDQQRIGAVLETLRSVFPSIESFSVKGPWRTKHTNAENLIFFAGAPVTAIGKPEFLTRIKNMIAQGRLPVKTQMWLASRRQTDRLHGFLLTDDYAPYDLLVDRSTPRHGATMD